MAQGPVLGEPAEGGLGLRQRSIEPERAEKSLYRPSSSWLLSCPASRPGRLCCLSAEGGNAAELGDQSG